MTDNNNETGFSDFSEFLENAEQIIIESTDSFNRLIDESINIIQEASQEWQNIYGSKNIASFTADIKKYKSDYACYVADALKSLANFKETYQKIKTEEIIGKEPEPYSSFEYQQIALSFVDNFSKSLETKTNNVKNLVSKSQAIFKNTP